MPILEGRYEPEYITVPCTACGKKFRTTTIHRLTWWGLCNECLELRVSSPDWFDLIAAARRCDVNSEQAA